MSKFHAHCESCFKSCYHSLEFNRTLLQAAVMPVYEYIALDPKGKNISGIVDADSAVAARQKLRASNNFPVSIKEVIDIVSPLPHQT